MFFFSRAHPSIHPSIRPSVHPSIHPSVRPSVHPSIHSLAGFWSGLGLETTGSYGGRALTKGQDSMSSHWSHQTYRFGGGPLVRRNGGWKSGWKFQQKMWMQNWGRMNYTTTSRTVGPPLGSRKFMSFASSLSTKPWDLLRSGARSKKLWPGRITIAPWNWRNWRNSCKIKGVTEGFCISSGVKPFWASTAGTQFAVRRSVICCNTV